jgi:DNA sulfur modification protein DndD
MRNLFEDRTTALDLIADHDRQLAGVPGQDAIAEVLTRRDDLRAQVAETRGRMSVIDEDVEHAERTVEMARAECDKVRQALAMANLQEKDSARVLEHSARVRSTLDLLKVEVRRRSIAAVETEVLTCFLKLLGKTRLLQKLTLDPVTCEPILMTTSGELIHMERLSAGERQLFAVSMLWGLARVSGRQLPTIIDTPLGRLDSVHRGTLVDKYFPNAADQVILLSTDEEIDRDLAVKLEEVTGRWYRIDYIDSDVGEGWSEIRDGYFYDKEADRCLTP